MIRTVQFILIALAMLVIGCANRPSPQLTDATTSGRVILFIPGVVGDGPWYDAAHRELSQLAPVEVFPWGAPKPLFIANFCDRQIHDRAEKRLAERIDALPASVARVQIVAHSAGCGVALGATAQTNRRIDRMILIAPSVSPTYDLRPALSRLDGPLHVFYSRDDVLFLKWRTSTFGTYDRVKTPAAGNVSFTPTPCPRPTAPASSNTPTPTSPLPPNPRPAGTSRASPERSSATRSCRCCDDRLIARERPARALPRRPVKSQAANLAPTSPQRAPPLEQRTAPSRLAR